MLKAMIVTVGTGRDRKDIASAICKSIYLHNPTEVIFVATELSNRETMPLILSDERVKGKKIYCELLSDENDLEKIKIECDKIIKKTLRTYKLNEVTVDYTSGTKAMSAGLILAAIDNKIDTLVYVAGKRDNEGRVISGTERVISFTPNIIYADYLFEEAIRLFNNCRFESCITIIDKVKDLNSEKEFQEKLNILKLLAISYSHWDKFNLNDAIETLKKIAESHHLANWGIKSKVEKNLQILYQECQNKFCYERMVDLFENSKRRYQEHKYDDAVARLYRLLEYIGQFFCAKEDLYIKNDKGEIDTSKINKEKKLPLELQSKYRETLELARTFNLLSDLNHSIGKEIYKEIDSKDGKLKKLLTIRNSSILAHGFQPIKEDDCEEFILFMGDLLKMIINNLSYLQNCAEFPKIKI